MIKGILKLQYIRYTIFLSVFTWCLLIIAAPFLAHVKYVIPSGVIYYFFSKICHQCPDRSLFIWGKQFAVCARCTGLYFGFLIGTLFFLLSTNSKRLFLPRRTLFFIALVPISIDVGLSIFQIWQNTHLSRLVTGLILGSVIALFVVPGIFHACFDIYKIANKTEERIYGIKT